MKMRLASTLGLFVLSFVPVLAQKSAYPFNDPTLPAEKRIDNLLSLMTIDEKIHCLGTNTAVPRLGVPNFGASEGIHGVVQRGGGRANRAAITTTQFPQPPGMGESWDPALVREAGGVEGYEARFITQTEKYDRQILMLWGPQSDLARDPRWGRSEEVYGEDPFFNGTMAVAFIKGLQGDDPKYWQAAALLKHFLANSNEDYRTSSSSNFDQRLFWEYYSVPFRMGFVDGGAKGVMASYNAWNGTPMAINPILKSIVQKQWGVDVLSSDGGAVRLLVTAHKRFANKKEAVVACLTAGINQFLDTYQDETKAALKDGSVTEAEIDDLLRPKFRITLRLGLLDPPEMVPYSKIKDSPEPWNTEKDRAVSKQMALESVVLLKNADSLLPLNKDSIKSIAVIGPLADSVHWDWYGGTPPYAITPLQGIKDEVGPGVKVNYAADEIGDAAYNAAKSSDVAVVVVGNDPTCGPDMAHDWHSTDYDGGGTLPCTVPSDGREGRDRESIDLAQEQLVKQVYAANSKTIVILVSSFPFAINWSQAHVPAILHMAHSSQDEGTALAKVLFGDYNPAGRLVTTWPRSLDQLPPMMDYDIRHGRTYMYFKGDPLYPFGYGLSYTTFRYSNLRTSSAQMAKDGTMTVSVDVTNTGSRAGDEVVQLYVKHLQSKVERPREELKGFQRVTLQPNETKTVQIPLKASALAYWDETLPGFRVETEPVSVMIGSSSSDIKLTSTIRVQ
ncbi:glycoside hydrolase family 3 C-terminal domain-containing protein [Alloacidobacterium sp.]|uniref:glycoside hydrolase family 3 C-terminal domain-containing protein n=1 Tax=Alloacidobacterium sp. TaxID=2951999 RepID=UPI002D55A748|nr:glycoside hydrolase family 3 C-terminal domain-containing protein [Alloacidobacterium sp.]HYK36935.1 glycoside hydrolase family 3 C-terminal domain-containing protein [Alloacidobacterium sp.]